MTAKKATTAKPSPKENPPKTESPTVQPPATATPPAPLPSVDARPGAMVKYSRAEVDLIKKTVAVGASDTELKLFLYTCQHTGLNPLLRQIYSIRRRQWNGDKLNPTTGKKGDYDYTMTTQLGIDGLRLIAQRTGEYQGQRGAHWCGADGKWKDVWLAKTPPSAARVGIMRRGFTEPVWGVARYDEYVQTKAGGVPTLMWKDKSSIMLAKCAEAQGLRKAFPAELSGLYTFEEMKVEEPASEAMTSGDAAQVVKNGQRIHILAKQLGYSEEDIHNTLEEKYGVSSTKNLTLDESKAIIDKLTKALANGEGKEATDAESTDEKKKS